MVRGRERICQSELNFTSGEVAGTSSSVGIDGHV